MDISNVLTKDIGKAIGLRNKIRLRDGKKQASDQLVKKLEQLTQQCIDEKKAFTDSLPKLNVAEELPIAQKASEIIRLLSSNQVIIVAGETGCGKTTQLPKICLQAGLGARGGIAHTQPRRVAATSVARRIAEEVESELGQYVGYSIRFNQKISKQTRVKLMTDGVLLSEIEFDPFLSKYEVLIIDEAHERSLNIDFLLGFIKQLLPKRPDLKLIITSATIDPQKFSKSFDDAPIVTVEGRSYPVEVRYRPLEEVEDKDNDVLMGAIVSAVDECYAESNGNILIFADGEAQIKNIVKVLHKAQLSNTEILALYARLGMSEQQKIFSNSNKRKIIVSTNVAETSLTVPGIIFVIDIGNARISRFSQRNKIQQLPVEKISRASADQRKGRCGRIAPGICIRLYSEEDYLTREEFTPAEIKRTNLSSVALRLKAMKVENVESFPFIESPSERAWKVAFSSLYELAAIDDAQFITSTGEAMAKLPVDPQLARILVDTQLTAVNEMLVFCALMSVREIRERPHDMQQKADQLHRQYYQKDSDVLTAIELWKKLEEKKQELSASNFRKWCSKNLINFLGWLEWRRVYFQLKESVELLDIKVNPFGQHSDEIHRALIPGFVTHIFQRSQETWYQGVRGLKVWLHPSSLSFKKKTPWLISAEMIETEKLYARMNAAIKPDWIEHSVPHLLKSNYQDIQWHKKKGHVVAMLNQSLFGLPIVTRRPINYSNIDAELCRKIFLKSALAEDQLNQDFPFIKNNRKKLIELERQEQKQRLNNIRIDKQMLADLYDEVLPDHILSEVSLKRWLKKDFKARNSRLCFKREQLTLNQVANQEDYPSQIEVKGVKLNLSYSFAPGTEADGVSVEIPQSMINQFSDRDFDWLVPGYLQEKILAAVKALPKSIRRDLIPLNETAGKCYQALRDIDKSDKLFINELAKILQKITGKRIREQDFELDILEPFLNMKYKIAGKSQSYALKSLGEFKLTAESTKNTQTHANIKIIQWPQQKFEIEKTQTQGKQLTRIFQGFQDHGSYVCIEQFANKEIAEKYHLLGVSRLLMLQHKTELQRFYNTWPDKQSLEKLNLRSGGFKLIFDTLALFVARKSVLTQHPVATKLDFKGITEHFNKNFRVELSKQLELMLELLKLRESIYLKLSDMNASAYSDSVKDIRKQLGLLWSQDAILMAEQGLFEKYKRYLAGVQVRIKRILNNFPKEQQSLDTWLEWLEWWRDIDTETNKNQFPGEYQRLFWQMQEFRLSLFSPGIKVGSAISAKKLQKSFEAFENLISLSQ